MVSVAAVGQDLQRSDLGLGHGALAVCRKAGLTPEGQGPEQA